MTDTAAELDRLKARRATALHRLDLIAGGAQLTYDDGAPVNMVSEKLRQETVVADMDRRIEAINRSGG
ncbi:MAG: hypothetical protein Q8L66_16495 [Caulobacter sp.]|nr:hypothetical protein [Caulobacter sp.]